MRDVVEFECSHRTELALFEVQRRTCEHCEGELVLSRGRHSGNWFWSHLGLTGCKFDACQHSIMFKGEMEAREATEIFRKQ